MYNEKTLLESLWGYFFCPIYVAFLEHLANMLVKPTARARGRPWPLNTWLRKGITDGSADLFFWGKLFWSVLT